METYHRSLLRCAPGVIGSALLWCLTLLTPVVGDVRLATAASLTLDQQLQEAYTTGDGLLKSGKVPQGAETLLQALRRVDAADPASLDKMQRTMHLLTFAIYTLMTEEEMQVFLTETLQPDDQPADAVVRLYFDYEYEDYGSAFTFLNTSESELRADARAAMQSSHKFVQAAGLAMVASARWDEKPEDILEIVQAMNGLIELCPEAQVTQESFRSLLSKGARAGFTEPKTLRAGLALPQWSRAARAYMAKEPALAVVQQAWSQAKVPAVSPDEATPLAVKEGVEDSAPKMTADTPERVLSDSGAVPFFEAARNHSDSRVRDWCLRAMANTHSLKPRSDTAWARAVRGEYQELVADIEAQRLAKGVGASDVQPLEQVRAMYLLFANAEYAGDFSLAKAYFDKLVEARWDEEPFDTNLHERICWVTQGFGMKLVEAGHYEEAATVFGKIRDTYPGSALATSCQQHIGLFQRVLKK